LPSSGALNTANTAPVVHGRQNPARRPIETAPPRSMVGLIEASRFKRRCVVVTRSLLMLELTMRLLATCHVNENDVPLLEMASTVIG
jgi:hypothetical protein